MSIILIIGVHIDRLANAHRAIRQCSHLGPPAVKSSLKAFSVDCITSISTRHDGRHFCALQVIVIHHQQLRLGIGHLPEGDKLRLCPCEHQRAAKPVHPLALLHLPQSGLAGREHHQLCAAQIKLRGFGRGENAIVVLAGAPHVGPGQGEPRAQQRIRCVSALKLMGRRAPAAARWSLRKNPWVATCRMRGPWSPLSFSSVAFAPVSTSCASSLSSP
jgi:hypothetical protein